MFSQENYLLYFKFNLAAIFCRELSRCLPPYSSSRHNAQYDSIGNISLPLHNI